ncbi:hypothetical protein ACSX1A_03665 [Pontibacter sp. MBLB2868]|uniref:hypothetical protein n=1 Tax=Pontibacter sp. MBLB2868 TaxID=3451555 RepID=UPI003F74AFDB
MKTNFLRLSIACFIVLVTACSQDEAINPAPVSAEDNTGNVLNGSINPANFVTVIDNPYFPLKPGYTYFYINTSSEKGEKTTEYIKVYVTHQTKEILGVTCRVVHDVATEKDGTVIEDTYDWYAQDKKGNVWYFGEYTKAYEDGEVSTEGSWQAGVDGAKPGIIMWANPRDHIGQTYYQEFYPGEAEDQAKVLPSKRSVKVPYGIFHKCLTTEEFTALEPDVLERKSYAKGIGMVLAQAIKGGKEREVLVKITHD